tara:strand:+ start:659381 stop:660523 length:1143 start_codon:yes stop_codon:yes gene_type:complete
MLIQTQADFDQALAHLKKANVIAVDTEFHRERTYYPELCLIQVGTEEEAYAIDPLAKELDLQPLLDLLLDPKVVKVFHAARQDLEIFQQMTGKVLPNVFDTQIAAMALGFGEQISYINLIERTLSTRLSKAQQLTNWQRRPLTDQQLRYALDDVVYLIKAYHNIINRLKSKDRLSWLDDEEERLLSEEAFASNPDQLTKGMRLKDRSPQAYTALRRLALWRDEKAQEENRPRHYIIKNEALIVLAQQRPTTAPETENMRMISKDFIRRYGSELFPILQEIQSADAADLERPAKRPQRSETADGMVLKLTQLLVAHTAEQENITPRLIATTSDIEDFILGKPSQLDKGWRYELLGKELKALLKGEMALFIEDGSLVTGPKA